MDISFFRERSDEDLEEYYRRKYVETTRKYVEIPKNVAEETGLR